MNVYESIKFDKLEAENEALKEINKSKHKNCINKEELIKDLSCAFTKEYIIELINNGEYSNQYVKKECKNCYENEKIENGDFDNE